MELLLLGIYISLCYAICKLFRPADSPSAADSSELEDLRRRVAWLEGRLNTGG